jgi:hypothetical protein
MPEAKPKITFTQSSTLFVLGAINYETDKEGYIIDGMGERVAATDGNLIKAKELAGLAKVSGETIFVRNDPASIMKFVKEFEEKE